VPLVDGDGLAWTQCCRASRICCACARPILTPVRAGDAEGRKQLAQYMLRAPFSLEKMTYLAETGMVMYRSHMHKSLKRNFQLMPGAQWLEMLCRHVPDRFEHLVR
jgi:hypothetical protein